ncbi:MAG TPA: MerR family transcriptional regulator [Ilumatobacter sp.]|nr:MerR family transcriptional regulator [Ilumatobacter sp.]
MTDTEDDTSDDASTDMRLVDLARATGVTERTIRYYQAEKLLPTPAKRGRDAIYGEAHVERLALIGELRDRGMNLNTIRDLISTGQPARTVSEWLGVDATLSAPWSDDRPRTFDRDELITFVEQRTARHTGLLGELQDNGYVRVNDDGGWFVPSPALLASALELREAGIDLDVSSRLRDLLRRRLARSVDEMVSLIVDRLGSGFAGDATPEEIERALGALRPIAREMSGTVLAQEVERALAELLKKLPKSKLNLATKPKRRQPER